MASVVVDPLSTVGVEPIEYHRHSNPADWDVRIGVAIADEHGWFTERAVELTDPLLGPQCSIIRALD